MGMDLDPGDGDGKAEVTSATTPACVEKVTIYGKEVSVEFVQHALDRMKERRITVPEVLTCLRSPDQRGLPADLGRQRVRRCEATSASRALDVVYE
jgi:hypothetical protein